MGKESRLTQQLVEEIQGLKGLCEIRKVGEMHGYPVGYVLNDPERQGELEIWIADTSYGPPWVVLGTAESEQEFWRGVHEDSDLMSLKPIRPARVVRANYLQRD